MCLRRIVWCSWVHDASIAARLGDKDQAVDLLRDAFSQRLDYGVWLHCDPTLEPLRGYPPFEELVRPKG